MTEDKKSGNLELQMKVAAASSMVIYWHWASDPKVFTAIAIGFAVYSIYPWLYLIFGFIYENWDK